MRFITFFFVFILSIKIFAQADSTSSSVEIFVIDSYITQEVPNKFVLSFSTSDSCKSKLNVMNRNLFDVSKSFTDNHKIEIELSKLRTDSSLIKYEIFVYSRDGKETKSDQYEVEIPKNIIPSPELNSGLFKICLGGIVFAIPSPAYVINNGEYHWGISKEIPLLSFYSVGYNYPEGYIAAEYSHIFGGDRQNFLRFGYKQIIQINEIKYVSPGLNFFTDLQGYNGLSAEFSVGLFQIQNIFTVYTRYRYNFQLKSGGTDFHEFSFGLYSNFFSLNL